MSKDSATYWKEREESKLHEALKDVERLDKELKRAYRKASKNIEEKISLLFLRYAKDNKLSYHEANKLLSSSEFIEWRMDLQEYIKLIESTKDERLLLELNTLAMKSRITRLEEMLYQINKEINTVTATQTAKLTTMLENTARESYYKNIFDMQKFKGIGSSFALINKKEISDILKYPWSGRDYSDRIWSNREKLKDVIKQEITQMTIQGKGNREVAKNIAEKMNASYKNAIRIVDTEHAYVTAQAKKKSFESLGADKYQLLATLDNRTSKTCQSLDGKVFLIKEALVGVNYPPLHPNCRTVPLPYLDDIEEEGTRTARGKDGKTYEVPANMKYKDWYKKYVGKD